MTSALKSTEALMNLSIGASASEDKKQKERTKRETGDDARGSLFRGSR